MRAFRARNQKCPGSIAANRAKYSGLNPAWPGWILGELKYLVAQGWTITATGTCPIIAFEATFARETPLHPSLTRKASLFAFKNDSHVGDAHWFRVHRCLDFPENLCGELAVLLLGSNVPTAVTAHDILGNRSLVRDPTRLMAYKSTVRLQRVVGELNTIFRLLIVQVMQNAQAPSQCLRPEIASQLEATACHRLRKCPWCRMFAWQMRYNLD